MLRELLMSRNRRKSPRAQTFIGNVILLRHADAERGPRVIKVLVDMIVIDHHEHIGLQGLQPLLRLLKSAKQRLPARIIGHVVIDRKSTRLNSSHVSESRMPSS